MKKTVIITAAFAALLSLSACEREIADAQLSGEGLRINLTCEDIGTRAEQPGVGNENLLRTVDVFLFNSEDEEFKHHWRFSPEIESNFTCFIQSALIVDGTYNVYSIVNYPGAETDFVVDADNATLEQLEALVLEETSQHTFTTGSTGLAPAPNEDLSLVMTGMAEGVSIEAVAGQTLVGNAEISLTRLPAKVTMDFYLKDQVVNTKGNVTETWTPLTEGNNIRVYLCNGASEALVGGAAPDAALFDYEPNLDNTLIEGKTGYSTAFSSAAFYSYPESWDYGAASEPYLKLIVPWKLSRSVGGGTPQESQKEFYYKVMLPTNTFASNHWYHLMLDVTQLGGNADDDAVNIPCGYQVVDWKTGSEITSTMSPGYYLDVNVPDLDDIKFYGNTLDINYFASGTVVLRNAVKKWNNYKTGTVVENDVNPGVGLATDGGDYVHIDNTLNYDFDSDGYDVSPYTYTIKIGLADDENREYDRTLTVTQYPPLYITNTNTYQSSNNTPTVYVNATYNTNNSPARVWDNSGTSTIGDISSTYQPHFLGTVSRNKNLVPDDDFTNANNENPNLYSVTTTILKFSPTVNGQSVEAVLGDPRGDATNEYQTVLTGGNSGSGLTNYRPAAENTQNVISPRFIAASSYGRTQAVTYEGARKRCAAYQEFGYPAGRWRLPTQAEILFLQKLNHDEKIPSLFGASTTDGYWAAGSLLYVKDSSDKDSFVDLSNVSPGWDGDYITYTQNGTSYRGYIRCVYDTWYWGDAHYTSISQWRGYQTDPNAALN